MVVLDQHTIDRISTQAHDVHFGRTLVTIITALFYGIGWVTAKIFTVLWLALAWIAVAVKVGWQDARKDTRNRGTS